MRYSIVFTALVLFSAYLPLGCKPPAENAQHAPPAERPLPSSLPAPGSVEFKITSLPNEGNSNQSWHSSYTADGKTASFGIELDSPNSSDSPIDSSGLQVEIGKGRFLAEPGSDSSILITNLKKALQAKSLPVKVKRARELPFSYAILGRRQTIMDDGGFSSNPPGNWTAIKVFLGSHNDDIELFLNIDALDGRGQFSIKDPDYGDDVLKKLAAVL